jgi:hypothetical protein
MLSFNAINKLKVVRCCQHSTSLYAILFLFFLQLVAKEQESKAGAAAADELYDSEGYAGVTIQRNRGLLQQAAEPVPSSPISWIG